MAPEPWSKEDPDTAFDLLPQPYRFINKILDEVLDALGEEIHEIVGRRRSRDYEFALPQAQPTCRLTVSGRVTCANVETRGTSNLAIGTSHGEVVLVDTRTEAIAMQAQLFGDGEEVRCVAVSSNAAPPPPPQPSQPPDVDGEDPSDSAVGARLLACGSKTSRILCLAIEEGAYSSTLQQVCVIDVEAQGGDDDEYHDSPVLQLRAEGASGGHWALALLRSRNVHVFFVPSDLKPKGQNIRHVVNEKIAEEDEAAEEGTTAEASSEEQVPHIKTPTYCLALPHLAPAPSLPEPALSTLTFMVVGLWPDEPGRRLTQAPTYCFTSSTASNIVLAHSIKAPGPLLGATLAGAGAGADALLALRPPAANELREPLSTTTVNPHRRWVFSACTTAMAVSANGGTFALGGSHGAIALVNTASGLSVSATLPGHYAAVAALALHKAEVLVSVGADAWVHHYCVRSRMVLSRHLCTQPPSPPPASAVVASQTLPLALTMDAAKRLRLVDLRRGCKAASVACSSTELTAPGKPGSVLRHSPQHLFSTANSFCVLIGAEAKPAPNNDAVEKPAAPGGEEGPGADGADALEPEGGSIPELPAPSAPELTELLLFGQRAVLHSLYPGLAARTGMYALADLFDALTPEELATVPEPEPSVAAAKSTAERTSMRKGSKLSTSSQKSATRTDVILDKRFISKQAHFAPDVQTPPATSALARLTEENLRRMGKPGLQRSVSALSSAPGQSWPLQASHAVREDWQVVTRKGLKDILSERNLRQGRIQESIEALRVQVEDG